MQPLPSKLYKVKTVVALEQLCINEYGIPGYTLMRRAGKVVFDLVTEKFSLDKTLLVLCGAGNNAGDGYVIARLARQHGYTVNLISLINPEKLKGDAYQAYLHWLECGSVRQFSPVLFAELSHSADIVIDALLGTGLSREVSGDWKDVIDCINRLPVQVVSVDVPSGLNADTGASSGAVIEADYTVAFIGLKTGLFTGSGRAYAGQILFDDLGVPEQVFAGCNNDASLLNMSAPVLAPRSPDSHKGKFGHVLIVGGNVSMAGAVMLAAKAALRSGAGLVSVFTRTEHVMGVTSVCPEAMVTGCDKSSGMVIPGALLERVSHIAIGPGLGQDAWANACLQQCLATGKPLVIDADGLNLLASTKCAVHSDCVLTPHPGEAARLLNTDTETVSQDRLSAVISLSQKLFNSEKMAIVLKGSGSLVSDGSSVSICPWGNPAMATAGMGDVLTGVIVAFMAQGLSPLQAAECGVVVHGMAGDKAAEGVSRGVLASDVVACLPQFI